jgi:hypothetical protein
MNKTVLLASFIFKDRLDWFLNYLSETLNIQKKNIFVYDINDEYKYMVTYKFTIEGDNKVKFKDFLHLSSQSPLIFSGWDVRTDLL